MFTCHIHWHNTQVIDVCYYKPMMLYMRRLVKLTSRFIIITWIVDTFLTMSLYTMWMILRRFKNGVPSCWKVFWYVYHTQDIKSIKINGHMVAQDGFDWIIVWMNLHYIYIALYLNINMFISYKYVISIVMIENVIN